MDGKQGWKTQPHPRVSVPELLRAGSTGSPQSQPPPTAGGPHEEGGWKLCPQRPRLLTSEQSAAHTVATGMPAQGVVHPGGLRAGVAAVHVTPTPLPWGLRVPLANWSRIALPWGPGWRGPGSGEPRQEPAGALQQVSRGTRTTGQTPSGGQTHGPPRKTGRPSRSTATTNPCEWGHKLPEPASLGAGAGVLWEQPESCQAPHRGAPLVSPPAVRAPGKQATEAACPQLTGHRHRLGQQQPAGHERGDHSSRCPMAIRLWPPRPPGAELCTLRHLGRRETNTTHPPPRVLLEALSGFTAAPQTPGATRHNARGHDAGLLRAGLHRKNTKVKPSAVEYPRQNASSPPTAATSPRVVPGTQGGGRAGSRERSLCQRSSEAGPGPSSPSDPSGRTHPAAEPRGPHAS